MEGHSGMNATLTVEQDAMIPKFMFDSLKSSHESLKHRYEMLENKVSEAEKENSGLKRQQTQDKNRIAQLEKDYLSYRNTLRQEQSIIYHPRIQQTRDRIILCKLLALEALKKPDENGFFEFNSDEAIKGAHISNGAFFDGMTSLEKYGVVERDHENYTTTDKRVCRVKINPAVREDVANCITNEVASNYGGARATQCPKCHKERIKKTRKKATVCLCMDCKEQWVEDESEKVIVEPIVTAHDYAEAAPPPKNSTPPPPQETLFEEDATPPPASAESTQEYDGPFPPPARPCLKCGTINWKWDETFGMYLCATDHKEGVA
jgi:hypothetical protein